MSRILQAANFVAPNSGGIRTVLNHLADGYAGEGHDVVQIVPGPSTTTEEMPWGRRITLAGLPVPGTGYRVLTFASVAHAASGIGADRIEVHDRSTLRGLGRWARERDIPSLVVSHERLDRLVKQWLPDVSIVRAVADASNATLAAGFDTVVCTTDWAADEFRRVPATNLRIVALGVDTARFRPGVDVKVRRAYAPDDAALLVLTSRMSREKRPELAIATVKELLGRGEPVALAVAGDGPMRARLERMARGLPVTFTGHLARVDVARLLATADVAIAPGPVETFGLAALEALASGTPVVANAQSALREVLDGTGGVIASGTPVGFADAVQEVLSRPPRRRRSDARARAERYEWSATVAGFLDAHGLRVDKVRVA